MHRFGMGARVIFRNVDGAEGTFCIGKVVKLVGRHTLRYLVDLECIFKDDEERHHFHPGATKYVRESDIIGLAESTEEVEL